MQTYIYTKKIVLLKFNRSCACTQQTPLTDETKCSVLLLDNGFPEWLPASTPQHTAHLDPGVRTTDPVVSTIMTRIPRQNGLVTRSCQLREMTSMSSRSPSPPNCKLTSVWHRSHEWSIVYVCVWHQSYEWPTPNTPTCSGRQCYPDEPGEYITPTVELIQLYMGTRKALHNNVT